MRIQHNITALSAYRNLTNNNSMVAKNLEKLSSGYRINRAGDDAAGLAISEKMRAQITGLETAQKNANDGISLIQTAEGALTEVHSMLNRMVELANQSANGTYQDEDRVSLQSEVDALKEEIDRISKSTNFNGRTLLNGDLAIKEGTAASATTKVDGVDKFASVDAAAVAAVKDGSLGEGSQKLKFKLDLKDTSIVNKSGNAASTIGGNEISIKIGDKTVSLSSGFSLGKNGTLAGKDLVDEIMKGIKAADANGEAKIEIGGASFEVTADGDQLIFEMSDYPDEDFHTDFTTALGADGLKATLDVSSAKDADFVANQAEAISVDILQEDVYGADRLYAQGELDLNQLTIKDGTALKIGNDVYVFAVGKDSSYKDTTAIEGLDNVHVLDLTGVEEGDANIAKVAANALDKADNALFKLNTQYTTGKISLTEKVGAFDNYDEFDLDGTDLTNPQDAAWTEVIKTVDFTNPQTTKQEATQTSGGLTLQIGDTSDDFNQMTVGINSMASDALGIKDIDVSTQAGAKAAVDKIKAAINTVSAQRGDLGALQNRLEHTINNLSVTTENITAAESRIRDVDMAKEMMAYTKNNILVQASQAMLAQANQIPQGVLQLLQ